MTGGPVRITLLTSRGVVVEHKHFKEVVPAFYSSCPSQASRFLILAFEVHGYGAEEYFCSRSYQSDNLPEEAPVALCARDERMSAFSNQYAYP
ncbi:MAG: hypothetical protein ACQXXK_03035, partial [Methanothrix sp.]|uniref:hypothetical protein n=1 Tax=Methanothrix sp. TaxID=90426 RepID=UPI003D2BBCC8